MNKEEEKIALFGKRYGLNCNNFIELLLNFNEDDHLETINGAYSTLHELFSQDAIIVEGITEKQADHLSNEFKESLDKICEILPKCTYKENK